MNAEKFISTGLRWHVSFKHLLPLMIGNEQQQTFLSVCVCACVCVCVLDRAQRQEREVMLKLKSVVDKQRDELRAKVQEIATLSNEVEAVSTHTVNTRMYECTDPDKPIFALYHLGWKEYFVVFPFLPFHWLIVLWYFVNRGIEHSFVSQKDIYIKFGVKCYMLLVIQNIFSLVNQPYTIAE